MADNLFAPAWARVTRADQLRTTMAEFWNEHLAGHPYEFSLVGTGNGTYHLNVDQLAPVPEVLAVATGEWLYNIRSALDYLVWAVAAWDSGANPPPREDRIQYPIYETEQAWEANMRRLQPLSATHVQMLKANQPFRSDPDSNYLGWINRLARIDRHRHLNRVIGYVVEADPVLEVPPGLQVSLEWGDRALLTGQTSIARIKVAPWHEGIKVRCNPRVGIDPEIEAWLESQFWTSIHFSQRFQMIGLFVSGEIAAFEYDCAGVSRRQNLLSGEYRAESDERRIPGATHPRTDKPPTNWIPAGAANIGTAEFGGQEFPAHGPGQPRASGALSWSVTSTDP